MIHEVWDCPDCDGLGDVRDGPDMVICTTCEGEGLWCPACGKPASQCTESLDKGPIPKTQATKSKPKTSRRK